MANQARLTVNGEPPGLETEDIEDELSARDLVLKVVERSPNGLAFLVEGHPTGIDTIVEQPGTINGLHISAIKVTPSTISHGNQDQLEYLQRKEQQKPQQHHYQQLPQHHQQLNQQQLSHHAHQQSKDHQHQLQQSQQLPLETEQGQQKEQQHQQQQQELHQRRQQQQQQQ
eukprot:scpid106245/ scgid32942/ 